MTPEQICLVQQSFSQVEPISDIAAEIFYDTLFTLDPSVRPLFKENMQQQGKKLMSSIALVVKGLDDMPKILPAIKALGERHVDYGVKESHYITVGQALLKTLETGLGEEFTPEVRRAWEQAYTALAGIMIEAAYKKAV